MKPNLHQQPDGPSPEAVAKDMKRLASFLKAATLSLNLVAEKLRRLPNQKVKEKGFDQWVEAWQDLKYALMEYGNAHLAWVETALDAALSDPDAFMRRIESKMKTQRDKAHED
jgi:hypothetical protein